MIKGSETVVGLSENYDIDYSFCVDHVLWQYYVYKQKVSMLNLSYKMHHLMHHDNLCYGERTMI